MSTSAQTQPSAPLDARGPTLDLHLECSMEEVVKASSAALLRATDSEAIADIIRLLQRESPDASAETPIKWQVAPDEAATWKVVWALIKEPAALAKDAGLTWVSRLRAVWCAGQAVLVNRSLTTCTSGRVRLSTQDNVEQVLRLADKYAFRAVMLKLQGWVCVEAFVAPPGRFPHLVPSPEPPRGRYVPARMRSLGSSSVPPPNPLAGSTGALRMLHLRELLLRCNLLEAEQALESVWANDVKTVGIISTSKDGTVVWACPRCRQTSRHASYTAISSCESCDCSAESYRKHTSTLLGQALRQYNVKAQDHAAAVKVALSVGLLIAEQQ